MDTAPYSANPFALYQEDVALTGVMGRNTIEGRGHTAQHFHEAKRKMSQAASHSFDALASQALALPPDERIELAQRLWESLESHVEEDEELFADIARRDAEIESGAVRPIPFDEAMRQIRDSLK